MKSSRQLVKSHRQLDQEHISRKAPAGQAEIAIEASHTHIIKGDQARIQNQEKNRTATCLNQQDTPTTMQATAKCKTTDSSSRVRGSHTMPQVACMVPPWATGQARPSRLLVLTAPRTLAAPATRVERLVATSPLIMDTTRIH